MASVIRDPKGFKRIQWCMAGGQRRTLRLGKLSQRVADAMRVRIEQVLAFRTTGVLDTEAMAWLEQLEDKTHRQLSRLGLVKPREAHAATLGGLMDNFFKTLAVKPGTRRTYEQTRARLETHFGAARALESITSLECDLWRQALREQGLAEATIARRVKTARQVFRQGLKWKLVKENPFAEVRAGSMTNRARMAFVSQADTDKLLKACADTEWRVIVSLSRYGGLRCPSEVLPLTWDDIDFDKGLIHVRSCKTEAYQGKDQRIVPLFPELRSVLLECFEQAEDGAEFVIAKHRLRCGNFRTQMLRIIKRAGLVAWPKPFHNLRSSRQTELAEEYPMQVVCAWLGNSAAVAMQHYLQVTDLHLARAVGGGSESSTFRRVDRAASNPGPGATASLERDRRQRTADRASGAA